MFHTKKEIISMISLKETNTKKDLIEDTIKVKVKMNIKLKIHKLKKKKKKIKLEK